MLSKLLQFFEHQEVTKTSQRHSQTVAIMMLWLCVINVIDESRMASQTSKTFIRLIFWRHYSLVWATVYTNTHTGVGVLVVIDWRVKFMSLLSVNVVSVNFLRLISVVCCALFEAVTCFLTTFFLCDFVNHWIVYYVIVLKKYWKANFLS